MGFGKFFYVKKIKNKIDKGVTHIVLFRIISPDTRNVW